MKELRLMQQVCLTYPRLSRKGQLRVRALLKAYGRAKQDNRKTK